jgi:hypothetical protein
MARRKQAAAEAVQLTPTEETAPQAAEFEPAAQEQPDGEERARQYRPNPFPIKTANLDGYKIHLQESRPDESHPDQRRWEMQIRFGDGRIEDRPSDAVIDFIKSHKIEVKTRNGPKEVNLFHWNDEDRAWGMEIAFDAPNTSRRTAEKIYEQVVELAAQERGAGRQR